MTLLERISRFMPGLQRLFAYRREDLRFDLVAGLAVAAVALPVGVAYAQLAGFNPATGLYASILPLVAYALFGTSRQLIVGPDAATCALVAAAVAPLAGGDQTLYLSLSLTLTFLAGGLCLIGYFLHLGALADFLSKPILVGFLNGTALSIILGQLGKIFGFDIVSPSITGRLVELISKLEFTHLPTLAVGLATFAVLAATPRLLPARLPAALVAMLIGGLAVVAFGLEAHGVKTIGLVPAGLPQLHIPSFPPALLPELLANAAGLALVSYTSMTLTARSFAAKHHDDIDADREFAALGAANIAAALSQGFAVSGADSRTAMGDASGGRTQMTGIFAALAMALVVLFFTHPLQYVPIATLGAVLVHAAMTLIDITALRQLYRIDWREFLLSLLATLGVVAVGAINAILFAVVLSLVRFIRALSRPRTEVLGQIAGHPGFHAMDRHQDATATPGLVILRFNGPLVFFNAAYFKQQVLRSTQAAGPGLKWFVLDMLPLTMIDATGMYAAEEVFSILHARGVILAAAGRKAEWEEWARQRGGLVSKTVRFYPTLRQAVKASRGEAHKDDQTWPHDDGEDESG